MWEEGCMSPLLNQAIHLASKQTQLNQAHAEGASSGDMNFAVMDSWRESGHSCAVSSKDRRIDRPLAPIKATIYGPCARYICRISAPRFRASINEQELVRAHLIPSRVPMQDLASHRHNRRVRRRHAMKSKDSPDQRVNGRVSNSRVRRLHRCAVSKRCHLNGCALLRNFTLVAVQPQRDHSGPQRGRAGLSWPSRIQFLTAQLSG